MGDTRIIRLAAHPHIELKLFNPLTIRSPLFSFASRVGEFGRINYRMHNKLMVADNQVMITGGRNIGDEYFSLETLDFQDIDVIGIGAIAVRASVSFDEYWNSYQSVPIADISPGRVEPEDLDRLRRQLAKSREAADWQRLQQLAWSDPFVSGIEQDALTWHWGVFEWIYDPAAKADPTSIRAGVPFLGTELIARLDQTEAELLIISPYFIPRGIGMESIAVLRARGVRVAVLTNSLAATDVIAVHSSYAPYRRPLLEAGVELWELRPLAGQQERASTFAGDSLASLHAKSYVYDRRLLFIGSINLDPRSMNLNTEAGVLVEQPELAEEAAALFGLWTEPSHAFQLRLGDRSGLRWEAEGESATREPDASWLRRLVSRLIALLPVESQM
jgi:putative cardiolipin synthase